MQQSAFPIYVSPGSQLKYYKPSFDLDLLTVIEKYVEPKDNVWDIGANCGTFGFPAAVKSKCGEVLLIEADTWLCNVLKRTQRRSEFANFDIKILCTAVSNNIGTELFSIANRGRASNTLGKYQGRSQMGGIRYSEVVTVFTLDSLIERFTAPNFIKIDVEGAEMDVLHGAIDILKKYKPKIYIEVGNSTRDEVETFLGLYGYEKSLTISNNILYI